MENLTTIVIYLQLNDRNGTYTDILDEIKEGELTIADAKLECIEILKGWKDTNLSASDIKGHNTIQNLIDSLKD